MKKISLFIGNSAAWFFNAIELTVHVSSESGSVSIGVDWVFTTRASEICDSSANAGVCGTVLRWLDFTGDSISRVSLITASLIGACHTGQAGQPDVDSFGGSVSKKTQVCFDT